jgi:hypothetical protein|tara:strand:- start:1091 stop:1681 length:591 start_codon:yes stop_codon:yes gene_type:complete
MPNFDRKSKISGKAIENCLLNEKDYKSGDYKIIFEKKKDIWRTYGVIKVLHFDNHLVSIKLGGYSSEEKKYEFQIIYFNALTDNDVFGINHIIAVLSNHKEKETKHQDIGSIDVFNNQYILRKRANFFSYTKIWKVGKVDDNNYDKDLSYEFATDEYVNYMKRIYGLRKVQRRKIKEKFKEIIDKYVIMKAIMNKI